MAMKGTLTVSVYDRLRPRLLSGELLPGSRLKISDFGAEYGVSLSVVRDVVSQLAEQGLVQASPDRGFAAAGEVFHGPPL
jgi:DNA-binding GntR family transcriptional regulator